MTAFRNHVSYDVMLVEEDSSLLSKEVWIDIGDNSPFSLNPISSLLLLLLLVVVDNDDAAAQTLAADTIVELPSSSKHGT